MKSTKILGIAILLMTVPLLCSDSLTTNVNTLVQDTEAVVSDASGIVSKLMRLPIDLAAGVVGLAGTGVGYVLLAGSMVIEKSGFALTKVGDLGSQIITTSQEHRTLTGVLGLAAVGMLLKGTDTGRYIAKRIHRAIQILLGLDEEEDMRCPCDDHRRIALYLNQE